MSCLSLNFCFSINKHFSFFCSFSNYIRWLWNCLIVSFTFKIDLAIWDCINCQIPKFVMRVENIDNFILINSLRLRLIRIYKVSMFLAIIPKFLEMLRSQFKSFNWHLIFKLEWSLLWSILNYCQYNHRRYLIMILRLLNRDSNILDINNH